uniref:Choline transporter-like protein n=1 Tax=Saccoglossus kowalevskii TaxID=10224 RepID=A0ABM0MTT8_SACKO|nr:PREDICTED: choline transporter-like protein 5-B-like [Saccoglossus kowalevskii]
MGKKNKVEHSDIEGSAHDSSKADKNKDVARTMGQKEKHYDYPESDSDESDSDRSTEETNKYGYTVGDPDKLFYKADSLGQICGVDVEDSPCLFYFDFKACSEETENNELTIECDTPQVCIEECPTENWNGYEEESRYLTNPTNVRWDKFICKYHIDPATSGKSPAELFEDEDCAAYYLASSLSDGRCVPDFILSGEPLPAEVVNSTLPNNQTLTEEDLDAIDSVIAIGGQVIDDVIASLWFLAIGLLFAAIVSFLFIVLMRWLARIMVFVIIFVVMGLLAVVTVYCFYNYNELVEAEENGQITDYDNWETMSNIWLGVGIALGIIFLILFLLLLFLRKRIKLAIALIAEASSFLATISTPTYTVQNASPDFHMANGTSCEPDSFYNMSGLSDTARCVWTGDYYWESYIWVLQFYNLFALVWLLNLVMAFGEMSLAGAFASYYWAFTKPDDIKSLPVIRSMWRSIRYHLGSLAFGSLVLTFLRFIRWFLQLLEKKFMEDLERNDGTPEKPYYMSKSLMSICGVKNKKPKKEKKKKKK